MARISPCDFHSSDGCRPEERGGAYPDKTRAACRGPKSWTITDQWIGTARLQGRPITGNIPSTDPRQKAFSFGFRQGLNARRRGKAIRPPRTASRDGRDS